MSNLSRRSLVASAAALPALAVPAVVVAAEPAVAVLEKLVADLDQAWGRLGESCDSLAVAEQRLWNWKKLNPKATESEKREFASYCGYDEANAYQQSISDEINDIIDVANNTPARSMRGLVSKARIADKTLRDGGVIHSVSDERVWSIIDDLLAMGAVQS